MPSADAPAGRARSGKTDGPEGVAAGSKDQGRPVDVFTDCARSETFADGRCFSSHQAACKALDCSGACNQLRSVPPQAACRQ